jgi:LytS/YehU family sensor histidine kinase
MLLNAVVFYLNYYFLITKFMTRSIIQYGIASVLTVILVTTIETTIDVIFLSSETVPNLFELAIVVFQFNVKVHVFFWLVSGVLKTSINWIIQKRAKEALKVQHIETELALLKSQVHPHFLFNTLNTLYSSAYEYGDEETATGIGKLSHLLRYMLYETQTNKVQLENEIEYLENYLDLLNMRFSDQVNVTFSIEGEIDNFEIAPILLITLVENAFKHGVTPAAKTEIAIKLNVNKGTMVFEVINDKLRERTKSNLDISSSGLGLENLQKRLAMIYPDKHNFNTYQKQNKFIARLELT